MGYRQGPEQGMTALRDNSPVEGADDVLESPDTRLRTRTRPRVGAALRPALERPHWPLLLAVADTLALVAAFTIVVGPIETAADGSWHSVMAVFPVVALLALAGRRMYTRTVGMSTFDAVSHIMGATAVAALAAIVLGHETGAWVPRGKVELLWFASAALVGLGRVALGRLRRKALRQGLIGTDADNRKRSRRCSARGASPGDAGDGAGSDRVRRQRSG